MASDTATPGHISEETFFTDLGDQIGTRMFIPVLFMLVMWE